MIRNQTPAEILRHGLDQCACYGAPGDMMATLRGALALLQVGEAIAHERKLAGPKTPYLAHTSPAASGVQDE